MHCCSILTADSDTMTILSGRDKSVVLCVLKGQLAAQLWS